MYKCKQCDNEYETNQGLAGHMSALIKKGTHINKKEINKKEINYNKYKINENKYKCCDKIFTYNGIRSHYWRKHGNGINHKTNNKKGNNVWNKGLTKETSDIILKSSNKLKEKFKNGEIIHSFLGKKHKKETILHLKAYAGGIRKGAGRGKKRMV